MEYGTAYDYVLSDLHDASEALRRARGEASKMAINAPYDPGVTLLCAAIVHGQECVNQAQTHQADLPGIPGTYSHGGGI